LVERNEPRTIISDKNQMTCRCGSKVWLAYLRKNILILKCSNCGAIEGFEILDW